jgi:hypothetical protein
MGARGRRVYVFVEGFYLDRLALFEGPIWRCCNNRLRSGIPGDVKPTACGAWVRGVDRRSANRVPLERQDGPSSAVARNPSAQGIDLALMSTYGQSPPGESAGGSDHEVSPAGSVR